MGVIVFGNYFDETLRRFGGKTWDPDESVKRYVARLYESGHPFGALAVHLWKDAQHMRITSPGLWFGCAITEARREMG